MCFDGINWSAPENNILQMLRGDKKALKSLDSTILGSSRATFGVMGRRRENSLIPDARKIGFP